MRPRQLLAAFLFACFSTTGAFAADASNPTNLDVWFTSFPKAANAWVGEENSFGKEHAGPNGTTSWFASENVSGNGVWLEPAHTTETTSTGRFEGTTCGSVDLFAHARIAGQRSRIRWYANVSGAGYGNGMRRYNARTLFIYEIQRIEAAYSWTPASSDHRCREEFKTISDNRDFMIGDGSSGQSRERIFYVPVGVEVRLTAYAGYYDGAEEQPAGLSPGWEMDDGDDSPPDCTATLTHGDGDPWHATFINTAPGRREIMVGGGSSSIAFVIVSVGIGEFKYAGGIQFDFPYIHGSGPSKTRWLPLGFRRICGHRDIVAAPEPSGAEWPKGCPAWADYGGGGGGSQGEESGEAEIVVNDSAPGGAWIRETGSGNGEGAGKVIIEVICGTSGGTLLLDVVKAKSAVFGYEWAYGETESGEPRKIVGSTEEKPGEDWIFKTTPSGYEDLVVIIGDDGDDDDEGDEGRPYTLDPNSDNIITFTIETPYNDEAPPAARCTGLVRAYTHSGRWLDDVTCENATPGEQVYSRTFVAGFSNNFTHGAIELDGDFMYHKIEDEDHDGTIKERLIVLE